VTQHLLKEEMRKRGEYLIIKPLKWESDKISRITVSLEARYANNVIFHRHGMGELEDQLIQFPYSAHDDIIDAASGCCSLLKYPKVVGSSDQSESEDPMFDYVRKNWLPNNRTEKTAQLGSFLFGKKKKTKDAVPATKSFMAK